jgi:hypothetical protein
MFGVNFLLQSEGNTTAVVWATVAQRSSWLVWVTVCFEHLSRTAVGLMGSDDVEEMKVAFHQRAHGIVDDLTVRARLSN